LWGSNLLILRRADVNSKKYNSGISSIQGDIFVFNAGRVKGE